MAAVFFRIINRPTAEKASKHSESESASANEASEYYRKKKPLETDHLFMKNRSNTAACRIFDC